MSLNNIQLPAIVLQQLFQYSLIDQDPEQAPVFKPAGKKLFTLGNNRRQVLILTANEETLYLPDEQLNFLLGILAACNLTMEDVAILNIKKNRPVTYQSLADELSPEKIFLFGVQPAEIELPLEFPFYQVQQYNHQTYLTAPDLSGIQDDKAEKIKLWNCLKQIFGI